MKKQNNKIHIKQGDIVKIITGKDKGKIGEVIKIFRKNHKIIVQNINIQTKHIRPKKEGETGKIVKVEGPIHSSNVLLYSKANNIASRYNYTIDEKNIKQRKLQKTGEFI